MIDTNSSNTNNTSSSSSDNSLGTDLSLRHLFSNLEYHQKMMCVVDFSISQLSLEHVFLTLAEVEQAREGQ